MRSVSKSKSVSHVQVTFSCGCGGYAPLPMYIDDPDEFAAWIADNRSCPACFKAAQQKLFEEANAEAAAWAKQKQLPQLLGTLKQIRWAESIREKFLRDADDLEVTARPKILSDRGSTYRASALATVRVVNQLRQEQFAGWWIDHRSRSLSALILDECRRLIAGADVDGNVDAWRDDE